MSHGSGSSRNQRPQDAPPRASYSRSGHLRLQIAAAAELDRDLDLGLSSANAATRAVRLRSLSQVAARRAERIRSLMDMSAADRVRELDNQEPPWGTASHAPADVATADGGSLRRRQEPYRGTVPDFDARLGELDLDPLGLGLSSTGDDARSQPALRQADFTEHNRRSKRRKLDAEKQRSSLKGFRYGRYGQLEQGHLQMEIVSCDGGMFSNKLLYSADNILKDDKSVYCTKGNRCNIVLRHRGASAFTLQELVIKAPTSMNFSHPVREGMVFVSMEQDDRLSRTAQYQIQYTQQDSSRRQEPEPRQIISVRHNDDGTTMRRISRERSYHIRIGHDDDDDDDDDDDEDEDGDNGDRAPQMPPEFVKNLPDYRVTIECSDDEGDGDHRRHTQRGNPYRIGSLPFENDLDSDDSDDVDDGSNPYETVQIEPPSGSIHQLRRMVRTLEDQRARRSDSSLADAVEAHAQATQEAVRAVGGQLLTPHTRFYIEKDKSKCTIRFDPPISGRFILLKMWSSHHDANSNVDIQSVIARGFAGPRYFPSVQLR